MGNFAKRFRKLILPFAVAAKDRNVPFTKDMEIAGIYYLAERDRKKGEGRVLKKPEEKLAFIAEICYPLWLIPWRGRTLIFDGLEFTNPSIHYDVLPDVKAFDNDLHASSKSREAYEAALSQNGSYFQNFAGKEKKRIEGLIINPEFLQELVECLQTAENIGKDTSTKAILSPMLDASEVSASIDRLSDLRDMIEDEIKNLNKSMKSLSKGARKQVKALHAEMRETAKEFNNKIKKAKPKVMKTIVKIKEKRDEKVTRISKKHDQKLRTLHQNRVRIERTLERLSTDIERYYADIKKSRDNKTRWASFR